MGAEVVYTGSVDRRRGDWQVRRNGQLFDPAPSLEIRRHSPDGFSWGYAGSGPAQLALALLLDVTDNRDLSEARYQRFKDVFVAQWPQDADWRLTDTEIREWLEEPTA